jgi:deazaflavin-dependent oxidoreductase (nitroreductase family)
MIVTDDAVHDALSRGGRVEITTRGRRTGADRRLPLAFFNIDGRILISGRPGWPRSWLANLKAEPRFTFHLVGRVRADLPAEARVITDPEERRRVIPPIAAAFGYPLDQMVTGSPLIEVTFPDA